MKIKINRNEKKNMLSTDINILIEEREIHTELAVIINIDKKHT